MKQLGIINHSSYKKTYQNNSAFTLAEVLITLAIIGVVAALTLPSLMQNTQDAELKTAWKKAYAELNQVTIKIVADNGGSLKNICADDNCLRDLFKPYLKYIKTCDDANSWGNCWFKDGDYKYLNGSTAHTGNIPGFVLNNGSLMLLWLSSPSCASYCGVIYTDVNGFKGPNTIGKDVFFTHLYESKMLPYGAGSTISCPSGTGSDCSALYLQQ